jgi:hypothetical protein
MLSVRFTSPVFDSSHGLARAKRRNGHKGKQICMIYTSSEPPSTHAGAKKRSTVLRGLMRTLTLQPLSWF